MAHKHTVLTKMSETIELARNNKTEETVLNELYSLVDEYNNFVKGMDKKLDKVLSKMEAMVEDGR